MEYTKPEANNYFSKLKFYSAYIYKLTMFSILSSRSYFRVFWKNLLKIEIGNMVSKNINM